MRYLSKPKANLTYDATRPDVVSYLQQLYTSCAETLPDVRDDPLSPQEQVEFLQLDGAQGDPYAEKLFDVSKGVGELPAKRKKERKQIRGLKINQERLKEETRFLPPGTMKDHWEQYRQVSPLPSPASFPTFWRAACAETFPQCSLGVC